MKTFYQTDSPEVFADIRIDVAFKKAFGNPVFKDATIGLLNSIIKDVEIEDVEFIASSFPSETINGKTIIVDVICKDTNGNRFVVEMQRAKQKMFQERMVYYASKVISSLDMSRGKYNYEIPFTYVVAFLDFSLGNEYFGADDSDKCSLHYVAREDDYKTKLPGSTEYYFFDLTRFNKKLDEITENRDYWLYLLREVSKLESIPESVPKDSSFGSFFTAAMRANFSEQENLDYEKAMMNELDYENAMITAKEEGIEEGIEKGMATERIRMAKAMKSKGFTAQDISECTGFSVEEIMAL